jgi:ferrous iron transport protein B
MGFGCCVPAVLATRSLDSRKDRLLTIMIVPLMSCSARLPIYTLFAAAFFPRQQWLVVLSLYLFGIVLALLVARVARRLFFRGETAPLIIELPPYHAPVLRHLLRHTAQRTGLFLRKAGTTIALAVVLLWLLARLPWGADYASGQTFIGRLGSLLAPLFAPAGFGFWQAAVSLLAGIVAKELVVGTLGTLAGTGSQSLAAALHAHFTPLSAYAFMAMSLIYIPCIATIAAIRRETNWRWAGLTTGYSLLLGWAVAVAIYQVGRLLGF